MLTFAWLASRALAVAPHVVAISPPSLSVGVDAASVHEIVVTFDQPMDPRHFSVPNLLGHDVRLAGDLAWRDDHTFVVPVRLAPDRQYLLWFNHEPDHGFRSATGEVSVPVEWRIATAPAPDVPARTAANERGIERLRRAIDED